MYIAMILTMLHTTHYTLQSVVLTLHKPATDKAVHWDEAVIDNEHMGKKTSKCKHCVASWYGLYNIGRGTIKL